MEKDTIDYMLLKNQLCFPLYAASRETIKLYKPYLDELDLTYTQYISMMLLWEHKTMTVKELGEYLYLDSGTLTPLLKKLESKGFIHRARSKQDERNLNVTITDAGQELHDKAMHIAFDMGKHNPLSMEETIMLYRLLYKMLGNENAELPDWAE